MITRARVSSTSIKQIAYNAEHNAEHYAEYNAEHNAEHYAEYNA